MASPSDFGDQIRAITREVAFIQVELKRLESEGHGHPDIETIQAVIAAIDATCRWDLPEEIGDMADKLSGEWRERGFTNGDARINAGFIIDKLTTRQ